MRPRLIIFDLDGTLVNAYPAIIRSFNAALRAFGYPPRLPSLIRRAVGRGDTSLLKPYVRKEDLPRVLNFYRRHHARALLTGAKPFASTRRILAYLARQGYILAIASNRPARFTRILLKHLALAERFRFVLCADKIRYRKPHPQILRILLEKAKVDRMLALYVGDMVIDAQTGKRAGIKTIIVTTGSSSIGEIRKAGPYAIIHSIGELRQFV